MSVINASKVRLECAGDAVQLDATFAQRVEVEVSALVVVTDALSDSRIDVAHAQCERVCGGRDAGDVQHAQCQLFGARDLELRDGKFAVPGGVVHAEHAK